MITIKNLGPDGRHFDDGPGGWRLYEVRINRELICHFHHKRSDGLATCLRKAADAVWEKEI